MAECRFYGKAGGRRLACIVKGHGPRFSTDFRRLLLEQISCKRGAPVACLEEQNRTRIRRHSNPRFRPVLKLAPQLGVDRSANASVNADGMAKFSIYNFDSGTLVGSSPPRC